MNDPTRALKRLIAATVAVGFVGCAVCAMWALRPVPDVTPIAAGDLDMSSPHIQSDSHADVDDASADFNTDAFLITLWHTPPEAPPPDDEDDEHPQRKPEPLRVQLVAIIDESGMLQAALFDQQDNRIVIVSSGDIVHEHTVHVRNDAVEFTRGEQNQQLLLRPDERLAKGGQR